MSAEFATRELFDPGASFMVRYTPNSDWEGKTVAEIADMNNESPAEGLLRIIRETSEPNQRGTIVAKSMSEEDISNFMKWLYTSICTDGTMGGHPRGHGAFSRVLGLYVRDQKLMPLETAIQKIPNWLYRMIGLLRKLKNPLSLMSHLIQDLMEIN